ncbi:SDR family oxidoreductase [Streptomyces sp. TRM72054]|nr:SDR family oxidoreductase [Streptomyces sp. TRM72054]
MGEATTPRRGADPAEVTQAVAFLASDRAGNVTGAVVAAGGGPAI